MPQDVSPNGAQSSQLSILSINLGQQSNPRSLPTLSLIGQRRRRTWSSLSRNIGPSFSMGLRLEGARGLAWCSNHPKEINFYTCCRYTSHRQTILPSMKHCCMESGLLRTLASDV